MTKRPTIPTFQGSVSTTQLNTAFSNIKTAFDNTLSRDGSLPNHMAADLDMNSNDILNVKDINISGTIYANGSELFPANFNEVIVHTLTQTEGLLLTLDTEFFAVTEDGQTNIYQNREGAAVVAYENVERDHDFIVKQPPSATVLLTSASTYKRNAVPLRKIVGSDYVTGADAAAHLQAAIDVLAPAGIDIIDDEGVQLTLNTHIYLRSNLHFRLCSRTKFIRNFASEFATFGNEGVITPTTKLSNIQWTGGTVTSADPTKTGTMFFFGADDVTFKDMEVTEFYGGQAFRFYGNRIRFDGIRATTTDLGTGTGAFRMLGGTGFVGTNLYAISGDDCFQFVPSTGNDTNSLFHEGCTNSSYSNCYGISQSKLCIAAVSSSVSTVVGSRALLQNLGFFNIKGRFGTSAMFIVNDAGDSTIKNQIDNILFHNVTGQALDTPTSVVPNLVYGACINSAWANGVGRITMQDCSTEAPYHQNGIGIEAEGARVYAHRSNFTGAVRAMYVTKPVFFEGSGVYTLGTLDDNTRDVVNITSAAAGSVIRFNAKSIFRNVYTPTISGVVTPRYAIYIDGASRIIINDCEVYKASTAASGTTVLRANASTTNVMYSTVTTDCTNMASGPGTFKLHPEIATYPTTLLPYGTLHVTSSANASYNVTTLARTVYLDGPLTRSPVWTIQTTSATIGDVIRFIRTDSSVYTWTINNAGSVLIGTITAANQWMDIIYNGTTWELMGTSGSTGAGSVAWGDITSRPTTIAGFNITDAFTKTETNTLFGGLKVTDQAALLADTTLTYTTGTNTSVAVGNIIHTKKEDWSYQVAASGATDHTHTTAGGVKLYVVRKDNIFALAPWLHPTDYAAILIGDTTAQNETRVTASIQAFHNNMMTWWNGAVGRMARVQYPSGIIAVNDELFSSSFADTLYNMPYANRINKVYFEGDGTIFQSKNWGAIHAVRTGGRYTAKGITYSVPKAMFRWELRDAYENCPNFTSGRITFRGQDSLTNDPIAIFAHAGNLAVWNNVTIERFNNHGIVMYNYFNSDFNNIHSHYVGFQTTNAEGTGFLPDAVTFSTTGATVTASASAFVPGHVGNRIGIDAAGPAQNGKRNVHWSNIASYISPTQVTLSTSPSIDVSGVRASFEATRCTTVAGSTAITLSASVSTSLVGRYAIVIGAGLNGASTDKGTFMSTVVAHSGTSVTLAHAPAQSLSNVAISFGASLVLTSPPESDYARTDDCTFDNLLLENGGYNASSGSLVAVIGDCSSLSFTGGCKFHGASTVQNNFGGNFGNIVFDRALNVDISDAIVTHGGHSTRYGRLMFSGNEIAVRIGGTEVAWPDGTDTASVYSIMGSSPVPGQVYLGLARPATRVGNQVAIRLAGSATTAPFYGSNSSMLDRQNAEISDYKLLLSGTPSGSAVVSSSSDTTSGKLMTVGYGYNTGSITPLLTTDLNTAIGSHRRYRISGAATGSPDGTSAWIVDNYFTGTKDIQVAVKHQFDSTPSMMVRHNNTSSGNFTAWVDLSATGGSGGGSSTWGSITGTLSAQTDLQTALNFKSNTSHTHNFGDLLSLPSTLSGYGITDAQPLDADLTSLAGATDTNTMYYRSAANTWSPVTIGSNLTFTGGTLAAASSTPVLSVPYLVPATGEYLSTTVSATSGTLSGAAYSIDEMRLYPFAVRANLSVVGLAIRCSGAVASAQSKIICYNSDSNGRPDTLLFESSTLDMSTTGTKDAAWSTSLTLGQTIWVGVRSSSTASFLNWASGNTPYINGGTPAATARITLSRTLAFGTAAPSSWVWNSGEIGTSAAPAIWIKV